VDPGERSLDGWVRDAETRISEAGLGAPGALGSGVRWSWAGTFQALDRALGRLAIMIPVTLVAITALIRLNTRSWTATAIIVGLFPFSIIGAAWFLWALGYKLSVAVIVGMIAMAGLDAETSVVMLLYLRLAWEHRGGAAGIQGAADLEEVIVEGAARRLRPKLMTVLTDLVGFVPVFLVGGIGSDVMRRISAPMVGGLVGSLLVELLVFPALFAAWKAREVRAGGRRL
jgi:Cu(I)/Ag(I) efflux system membrane protein CusA/SilA